MLVTNKGVMIRFSGSDVSETGRATLGVHLIRLGDDTAVATMAKVDKEDDSDDASDTTPDGAPATDATVATPDSDAPEA